MLTVSNIVSQTLKTLSKNWFQNLFFPIFNNCKNHQRRNNFLNNCVPFSFRFGMCVDIDECLDNTDGCNEDSETCLNLRGSYACACAVGYRWNTTIEKCTPILAFQKLENVGLIFTFLCLYSLVFILIFISSKICNDSILVKLILIIQNILIVKFCTSPQR